MPERYKLRLSDGTVLVVDHDGLSTWLVDDAAMVLAPGVEKWRSLRAFMAAERRAASLPAAPKPVATEEAPKDNPPIGEPPGLLVLADAVAGSDAARAEGRPTSGMSAPAMASRADDGGLPAIPLKPRDDGEAQVGTVWDGDEESTVYWELPTQNVIDPRFLAAIIRLGYWLSPRLKPLDHQIRRWRWRPARGESAWTTRLVARASLLAGSARGLGAAVSRFVSEKRAWASRPLVPAPASTPPPSEQSPPVIEPLQAPPPIHEVPVLRLAQIDEPSEPETLFGEAEGRHAIWGWVKNGLIVACLLAAAVALAVNWEAWLPKAELGSRVLFGQVDAWARSREEGDQRSRALLQAREQLPYLTPATLQLVVSASPKGALDPPEVFRLSCDAADRGLGALPPAEARELLDLREQLIEALPPGDRDRVREYDQARAHRATLAFEDREALDLFVRGARAMPYPSRARLQELSGEAIAAGLQTPPGAPGRP